MAEIWNRYDVTAARPPRQPDARKQRPQSRTVDIHSHAFVPAAEKFVVPHLRMHASGEAAETTALNRKQNDDRRSRLTTLDERLGELDAMAIDVQLVKPAPHQCYYDLPTDIAVEAARLVNDGIAAFVARKPDRLVPMGTVPMTDGAAAAAELERCIRDLHFKGVQILTNVVGRELSDPAFAPFWAKAEALGAFVVLHPMGFTEPKRFSRFYFNNVIGNPLDTMVAVHYLIFDGVLERHPNLKIMAVHGGGYLPAYSGRIDHAWGARSDTHGTLPKPPSFYLRKFYFDTVVFTPHQLENLVRLFGAERILMGTDYPFDMGEYDPVGHVLSVDGFDEATVAAIAGGNAVKLLGL